MTEPSGRDRAGPAPNGTSTGPSLTRFERFVVSLSDAMCKRTIGLRFAAVTVGTAAAVFALLITIITYQLQAGVARQATELEHLSDTKLSERLDSEAKLAAARVRFQLSDMLPRLEAIAQRADTGRAVASRNVVAISQLLGPAAEAAHIDEILIVDPAGAVIGASDGAVDLLGAYRRINTSRLKQGIARVVETSLPNKPFTERMTVYARDEIAQIFRANEPLSIAEVAVYPLFDDFGEVTGAMVGYRKLRRSEPVLQEFSRLTNTGIVVLGPDGTASAAGLADIPYAVSAVPNSLLLRMANGRYIGRCVTFESIVDVCALAPLNELYLSRNELIRIAESDGQSLIAKLIGLGVLSLCAFAGISILLVGQVTRPLAEITRTVEAVAAGQYRDKVAGSDRSDEVGNIARAVEILQSSLRERDQLRANAIRQNAMLRARDHELNLQNMRFDAALNNMPHALCMFDEDGRLIVSNYQFEKIYRLPPGTVSAGVTERDLMAAIGPLLAGGSGDGNDGAGIEPTTGVHQQDLADGRTIAVTRQRMLGGGWVAVYEDITERRRAERRIMELATRDTLTKLPNRFVLRQRMELSLADIETTGAELTVYCLDLDAFKTINDTLGHPFGDLLLVKVAERLTGVAGAYDTIVRLGGDEFAVVTTTPQTDEARSAYAETIIGAIAATYDLDGKKAAVGVSIGTAVAPRDGREANELLKRADLALYTAKAEGKNTHRFFAPALEEALNRRRDMEIDLAKALEAGEFEPFFQPIVDVRTRMVTGFEALLRWRHPTRGLVPPGEFIPFAEEIGLIGAMGEWVLRRACEMAAGWPLPLKVSVNISPRQVRSRGLVNTVMNALAATGLPASRLELEVTESVLLEEDEDTVATLMQLRALGVRFAMDDFGTGYSSLRSLRAFPFDRLKIDQSFVRNMATTAESLAIVTSIIDLAESLGMATTAEGVETAEQFDMLRRAGCVEIQGFYFGRPRPNDSVPEVLQGFGMTWDAAAIAPMPAPAAEARIAEARMADHRTAETTSANAAAQSATAPGASLSVAVADSQPPKLRAAR
jgi:diguanylate cyclase (GGDEF)-like protein